MVGHTTYMCHCLNIGINIAHKYLIDEHEKYRQDLYLTLEEPAISGWKFELDKKGVTVVSSFASAYFKQVVMTGSNLCRNILV